MKKFIILAAIALSACANQSVSRGEFVPLDQLVQDIAAVPYECSEYDRGSDSCESVSTIRIDGNTVVNNGQFLLEASPRIVGDGTIRFPLVNGQACGDLGTTELSLDGDMPAGMETFVREVTLGILSEIGEVCVAYYRTDSPNTYLSEARTRDGQLMPDGQQVVTFFAEPKALRVVE